MNKNSNLTVNDNKRKGVHPHPHHHPHPHQKIDIKFDSKNRKFDIEDMNLNEGVWILNNEVVEAHIRRNMYKDNIM